MAPRVLYPLNISNPDRLHCDSGWIFADLLAPALADAGAAVTVAAPAPAGDGRADFIRTAVPGTKYRARFTQDVGHWAGLIRESRPDVVIANQVEAAPAIRTALAESGSSAMVAGYCHYLPFTVDQAAVHVDATFNDRGLGDPVRLAYLAGLAACDRVLVHSPVAAAWVVRAAARADLDLHERVRVVPAPRDGRLLREPASPTDGVALGVYNHRLYAHYGTPRFVALARRLAAEAPVRLRVMDLFGTRSAGRVALDDSPERARAELAGMDGVEIASDRGDRVRYRELLAGATFGIAPFRQGCPWSMSVIDCQGMGLPVIAPRMGWMADHIDAELLFDTDEEAVALAARLVTDREFYAVHAKRAHASTSAFAPAAVAARYLEAVA